MPTSFGESLVVRILPERMIFNFEQLGFEPDHLQKMQALIREKHGIVFATGPTGSGKSTTLYSALSVLNHIRRKIITIEDPIEYEMEGITQIQVQPEIGLTFARGLRSMLRHDPDVMMVGEVRDFETADIAIRVALTGHLILSTLHTNDAASGIARLMDIGVQPYLVASSVNGFIAQRLVRLICTACKREITAEKAEIQDLIRKDLALSDKEVVHCYAGAGCEQCNGTGYRGRIAIHELLVLSDEIRRMIFSKASSDDIKHQARAEGMRTLRQDGWKKVLCGLTTADEIMEVTPADTQYTGKKSQTHTQAVTQPSEPARKPIAQGAERRRYSRLDLQFAVIYRPLVSESKVREGGSEPEHESRAAKTENISASGMAMLCKEFLNPGDVVELTIELPDKGKPIQCIGLVLRAIKSAEFVSVKEGVLNRIAITFLAINSMDRLRIENFCEQERQKLDR
jgi:Tfp pilus assembly pilus retraction ATPase PilT